MYVIVCILSFLILIIFGLLLTIASDRKAHLHHIRHTSSVIKHHQKLVDELTEQLYEFRIGRSRDGK